MTSVARFVSPTASGRDVSWDKPLRKVRVRRFVIEQRGDKWCLLTRDRSRTLGCHPTRAGAEAQERAIQAGKHTYQWPTAQGRDISSDGQPKQQYELLDVEIFATGKWNGDVYTLADLDAMVGASHQVGFTPPLKAGHEDVSG